MGCDSVISPDLNVKASEIGLPLRFAKALSWPEPVTAHNVEHLRELVKNGHSKYPGANFVRDSEGKVVQLDRMARKRREALSKTLLSGTGQLVGRQLVDGDMVCTWLHLPPFGPWTFPSHPAAHWGPELS